MSTRITAGCGCGNVQFVSKSEPLLQFICHCADCRDASKEDFIVTAFFLADSTESSGDLSVREYEAACGSRTTRELCSNCGSFMFDKSDRFPMLVGVAARAIESPFEASPTCHVWTSSKLPGVTIEDDLPQHLEDLS